MSGPALRINFLLLGVALVLFAAFLPAPPTGSDAATKAACQVAVETPLSPSSDLMLSQVGIDLSDDFGFALEDSVELFRIDIQCRICGRDDVAIQSHVLSKVVPDRHAEISRPLLV